MYTEEEVQKLVNVKMSSRVYDSKKEEFNSIVKLSFPSRIINEPLFVKPKVQNTERLMADQTSNMQKFLRTVNNKREQITHKGKQRVLTHCQVSEESEDNLPGPVINQKHLKDKTTNNFLNILQMYTNDKAEAKKGRSRSNENK